MKVSRLRQIIKEEVQNIINEGTRWGIGIEQPLPWHGSSMAGGILRRSAKRCGSVGES